MTLEQLKCIGLSHMAPHRPLSGKPVRDGKPVNMPQRKIGDKYDLSCQFICSPYKSANMAQGVAGKWGNQGESADGGCWRTDYLNFFHSRDSE
jgi:hypothetical protein